MRCLFPEDNRLASVHTQPTRLASQFPDMKTMFQQATIPTTTFRSPVGRFARSVISKQMAAIAVFGALFDRRLIYINVRFRPVGIAAARRCKQGCPGSAR
jgi:hypothetical protein